MSKYLPKRAYILNMETGEVVSVRRGVSGYFLLTKVEKLELEKCSWSYALMNREKGVTLAQVEALLVGSMFGWEVPGANPERYAYLDSVEGQTTKNMLRQQWGYPIPEKIASKAPSYNFDWRGAKKGTARRYPRWTHWGDETVKAEEACTECDDDYVASMRGGD